MRPEAEWIFSTTLEFVTRKFRVVNSSSIDKPGFRIRLQLCRNTAVRELEIYRHDLTLIDAFVKGLVAGKENIPHRIENFTYILQERASELLHVGSA